MHTDPESEKIDTVQANVIHGLKKHSRLCRRLNNLSQRTLKPTPEKLLNHQQAITEASVQHLKQGRVDTHSKAALDAGMNGLNVLVVHQTVMDLQRAHWPHGIQSGEVGWIHWSAPYAIHL